MQDRSGPETTDALAEALPEGVPEALDVLVVGAGPAGLMAAEAAAGAGRSVTVVEAMPSPARKFLMAGRSGLNLTNADLAALPGAYGAAWERLGPMLAEFGPEAIRGWAAGLGQETFEGSSARVFPRAMKASPLLRAWLARLEGQDVALRRRWRWTGWAGEDPRALLFATPQGPRTLRAEAAALALGGASWSRLGSDGAWAGLLERRGVGLAPFRPANMGFRIDWSPAMAGHFGAPVKAAAISAGPLRSRAEFVISARGLEGGGVYAVAAAARDGAPLTLDLVPDLTEAEAAARLARTRRSESLGNRLRKALNLDPARRALLMEFARPLPADSAALAARIKALPVPHAGPRPMDEAISTAGGVRWEELDEGLMLRALPGVFCAGEMLDWEAPTGGWLLSACLATGRRAGAAAAGFAAGGGRRP